MLSSAFKLSTKLATNNSVKHKFLQPNFFFFSTQTHSRTKSESSTKMRIVPINVLQDNFSYLLIDDSSKECAAVDVSEADKVISAAKEQDVTITSILTTHHHNDHAGGNSDMLKTLPHLKIYGGDDRIQAINSKVKGGDSIKVGSIDVKVHFTPCHTSGHVLYEAKPSDGDNDAALFTGDTLFVGGCGRFFEGTPEQMYHALCEVIGNIPKETKVYCGHEYTVKNLQFALSIEPNNSAVKDKLEWAKKARDSGKDTIPSTIAEELTYNPFMRVKESSIAEGLNMKGANPVEIMKTLRQKKDSF